MILPALLAACGAGLLTQGPATVAGQIGINLLAGAGQAALGELVVNLTPASKGDLRRLLIRTLDQVKKDGERSPAAEAWVYGRILSGDTLVPETGERWEAWVRAVVIGDPEAIRDLIVHGCAIPDSAPARTVIARVGREFLSAFIELLKGARIEEGFKLLLVESLRLLHRREVHAGLPPEVIGKILALSDPPNLAATLAKFDRAQIVIDTIAVTTDRVENKIDDVRETLSAIDEKIDEKDEALKRAQDFSASVLDLLAEQLKLNKQHLQTIERLQSAHDLADRTSSSESLAWLNRQLKDVGDRLSVAMAERDAALNRVAELETDEVLKAALRAEADGDREAADAILEAKQRESRVTQVEMGCHRVQLRVRHGDLSLARDIWGALMNESPEVAAERVVEAALAFTTTADHLGHYALGVSVAEPALAFATERLGPEHPETLTCANSLTNLYMSQGRYSEAQPLYEDTLAVRRRVLGPEHPDALTSANNLAGLYESQGRYAAAESLYMDTLTASRRVSGPEHPDTLTCNNNLANLYISQCQYAVAEYLYVETLTASRRVLGDEHPNTLKSAGNLAGLYVLQGRYEEAEPIIADTLAAHRRVLGPEHPDTLKSAGSVGNLYERQGRYDEAEPLYEEAYAISRRVLGPEHPDTLKSADSLAGLYESQSRYDEAEPLYEATLAASRRVLGDEHPDTLISANNLANLYIHLDRYTEAEPLCEETLAAFRRVLGAEHPDSLGSANNLAGLYESQSRYDEAEPLYEATLEARRRVLGDEHPATLTSANNLAGLYIRRGLYHKAKALLGSVIRAARRLPRKHKVRRSIQQGWVAINSKRRPWS